MRLPPDQEHLIVLQAFSADGTCLCGAGACGRRCASERGSSICGRGAGEQPPLRGSRRAAGARLCAEPSTRLRSS